MLQNKIYQNYLIEIFRTFITILFGLTAIAWTVRSVNFLDLIVESGYPITTYFQYSLLNLFGILTKFIPLSFLISLTIFISKQIEENELIILWTSGVKKIQIVKLFFSFSLLITIFYILFSVFISPLALNKSRQLLGDGNAISFLPTIKAQQFNDSFNGLTFIVDNKVNNKIENIFLQDKANILRNLSTDQIDKATTTIIAANGIVEKKRMLLFNGKIISSSQDNTENDIVKFEQLSVDLNNIPNTTIKKPKIQETSTKILISCVISKGLKNTYCKEHKKKEILPVLNRRIILPFFIPVIALLSSLLLIRKKEKLFLNKYSIFLYSFLVLLYAELIIRYTGLSSTINYLFLISPLILSLISYIYLNFKFSNETF